MARKNTLAKLQKMGYSRSEDYAVPLQREAAPPRPEYLRNKNFEGEIRNHTIMEHITLDSCNYDNACVTGSIFRNCRFINCSMDQADFEFCEFYHCEFETKRIYGCSFNSSSFIDTAFTSVHFDSCTFTGVFFQKCPFDSVKISYSTLENAVFKHCNFFRMDMRYLNLDYIELDHPYMEDVTLPFSQTAFMFGALQYLKSTKDIVFVSKGNKGRMTPQEFFRDAVPLLRDHFVKTRQFFPLTNLCISTGDRQMGEKYLKEGILDTMSARDFRMLKHFCKLAAGSNMFDLGFIREIYYNYICRIFPQHSDDKSIPNYARHIMEIKALLFNQTKRPSFSLSLETNIPQDEPQKTGTLVNWLFSLANRIGRFQDNDIDVVLSYHSPLSVTINVSGEEDALAALLLAYLSLTRMTHGEIMELPVISSCRQYLPQYGDMPSGEAGEVIQTCSQELGVLSIHLSLLEYYVENFQTYSPNYETGYYFHGRAVPAQNMLSSDYR